jgi:hypothetical protein
MSDKPIEAEYEVMEPETGLGLVRRGMDDYVPELRRSPGEVKALIDQVEGLVRDHMRDGVDFMTVPGAAKPSLTKAGAERLVRFFGFGAKVEQVRCIEDWDKGLFYYQYRVGVGPITPEGTVPIVWCEGSANSRETKYRWRSVPEYKATEYDKRNGRIETRKARNGGTYTVFVVENTEPFDLINTLQKMAQKRAYVGAVLLATNTSEFWTQDLEDAPRRTEEGAAQTQQTRTPARKREAAPAAVAGPDFVWPGGKHEGERIGDVDRGYLEWYVDNGKDERLKVRAVDELTRRAKDMSDIAFNPRDEEIGL